MSKNIFLEFPLWMQILIIVGVIGVVISLKLIGSDWPPPKHKDNSRDNKKHDGYGSV